MQNSILIEFMEKYPDIAKGLTKRDKPTVDDLWQQLVMSLNSAAPPQNDVNGWIKTWTEWKSDIKGKLAQNQTDSRATGGKRLKKLDEDNERKLEINGELDELIKIEKENASSIRRVYRAIEKGNKSVANSVTALKDEFVRNNAGILRALREKNEIKEQQVELELKKFDYEKQKK